ncbi:MAG: 50S ribosomal protein L13 [Verrucomicrobiota bacterium]|nr:50S ribosomal protein L13 [Verrucomicrobiota bacterium]
MKSFIAGDPGEKRAWRLIDANGVVLGKLAVRAANLLRGRDRPTYTPHVDTGDIVVVTNAEKVRLSGKKEEKKIYRSYSRWPGGLKETPAGVVRARHPDRMIWQAVHGMLPGNHMRRALMRRLKIYAGDDHPHKAQNPQPVVVK